MLQLRLTRRAKRDLDDIWAYVAQHDPAAADRLILSIEELGRVLAQTPGMGRRRPELGHGTRSFNLRKYVIFYTESDASLLILRILHGARDLQQQPMG